MFLAVGAHASHRWICTVGESNFLVVDAFGTMPNRTKLELYGALYGGPNYNEGSAHAELDIDEYFHTSSWRAAEL